MSSYGYAGFLLWWPEMPKPCLSLHCYSTKQIQWLTFPWLRSCYLARVMLFRGDRLPEKVPLEQAAVKHVRQWDCQCRNSKSVGSGLARDPDFSAVRSCGPVLAGNQIDYWECGFEFCAEACPRQSCWRSLLWNTWNREPAVEALFAEVLFQCAQSAVNGTQL
jgi:hypothetical protein